MRFKRSLLLGLVAACAVIAATAISSRTASGVAALDSFKCYSTLGAASGASVTTVDEFSASINGTAGQSTGFCVPAALNYKGTKGSIANSDSYLTLYRLLSPSPNPTFGTAVVSNIFGASQTLGVGTVQSIAVVTTNTAGSSAHDLDNFICYNIAPSGSNFDPKGSAQLFDIFDKDRGIAIYAVTRFCLRVDLTVGSTTVNAGNNDGVLVCYGAKTDSFGGEMSVQNLIESATLSLSTANMFCVPSTLVSPTPSP